MQLLDRSLSLLIDIHFSIFNTLMSLYLLDFLRVGLFLFFRYLKPFKSNFRYPRVSCGYNLYEVFRDGKTLIHFRDSAYLKT